MQKGKPKQHGEAIMKKAILAGVLPIVLFAALPVMAEEPFSAASRGAQEFQAPDIAKFDKQAEQIQQNLKKAQEEMDQIRKTEDPIERERLLQGHWTTMQGTMAMMDGMWGPGLMGDQCCDQGAMGAQGSTGAGHMMGGGMWMKQRQYMMGEYMGLQQKMLDQIMQHQNSMWQK
jgi:hypothetical protein